MRIKEYIPFNIARFRAKYNPVYNLTQKDFARISQYNSQEFSEWQIHALAMQVEYAYKHVSFYHDLYSSVGYIPGSIKSIQDFEKLPVITKEMVKQEPELFLSDECDRIPYYCAYTGGSTDKPMKFYLPKDNEFREQAFYDIYWQRYGFKMGDKCVVLRGQKIIGNGKNKVYAYNRMYNTYFFDSAYLTDIDTLKITIDCINKISAKCIRAYPSSAILLAKMCKQYHINPPQFDIVILGSENVYKHDIEVIEKTFSAKYVLNSYGHSEQVLLGCLDLNSFSIGFFPQYGYMEIVDLDSDGVGELIGTNYSHVMPFIRYRTSDFAMPSNIAGEGIFKNCKFVSRIEGRLQEYVVTKDERLVSLCNIAGSHMPSLNLLQDMQYYQDTPGILKIQAITSENHFVVEKKIYQDFNRKFEDSMDIKISFVENIPRTNRGKKKMIVQKIDISNFKFKQC